MKTTQILFTLGLAALLPISLDAQTAPGSIDSSYQAPYTNYPSHQVVVQPDGKAILAGGFNGLVYPSNATIPPVARFNTDGTLDTTFHADTAGAKLVIVNAMALQPNGQIIAAGRDSEFNSGSNPIVARFNANGSLDATFKVTVSDDVDDIAFQSSGKILIAGRFDTVNGTSVRRLARLSATGALDTSFSAFSGNALTIDEVRKIALLPDATILTATRVSNGSADYLISLNGTTGSTNVSNGFFNQTNNGAVSDIGVDGSGRVVVAGRFDGIDGHSHLHVARFKADHSLDANFVGDAALSSLAPAALVIQSDGKIIVGGNASSGPLILRLNADTGSEDTSFSCPLDPAGGFDADLALQPDGLLLAAGQFQFGQQSATLVRILTGIEPPSSDSVSVTVPGTSNLWLAGAAAGTTASNGQDTLSNATPFRVPSLNIVPGQTLVFTASGNVANDPGQPVGVGPDGGPYLGTTFYSHAPENGVAKLTAPINSLIGVFLNDTTPGGTTPTGLDFSGSGTPAQGVDYSTLAPALRQPFFIGDGTDGGNVRQAIQVPAGATRLYLGALDPSDQENNLGHFDLGISKGPPAHGGLSETTFTVNGSDTAGTNLADTVLHFAANQTGRPAGLSVNVQTSTDNGASWVGVDTGLAGYMTFDPTAEQFVLNTTNYPTKNGVLFRCVSSAPGYPYSISKVVGTTSKPFNLASSAARAGKTIFRIIRNGTNADFDFRAIVVSPASGLAVRVQRSTTPGTESSWTDLPTGNAGGMTKRADGEFQLLLTTLPLTNEPVYFRAVATAGGGAKDSLSNIIGPYDLTPTKPPQVTLTPPAGGSGTGSGLSHPRMYGIPGEGTLRFAASASTTAPRTVQTLQVLLDGDVIAQAAPGANSLTVDYHFSVASDQSYHYVEAIAIDDLGVRGRAGTSPLIIQIVSSGAAASAGSRADVSDSAVAAASTSRAFTATRNGNWSDANTWTDTKGAHGVPGPADQATLSSAVVTIPNPGLGPDTEVGALTFNGGQLIGEGTLKVHRSLTISSGGIGGIHLQTPTTCTCQLVNDSDFSFNGTVSNAGTWRVRGRGGIVGLYYFGNNGVTEFKPPLVRKEGTGVTPYADVRLINTTTFQNDGVVATGLIPLDTSVGSALESAALVNAAGGTLISPPAASLLSQDGGGLLSQDGGGLISQDGGSLLSQDGGGLISQDGGGIKAGGQNAATAEDGDAAETIAAAAATPAPSGFIQGSGNTNLTNVLLKGPVTLNGGVLGGSGLIIGKVENKGGFVAPGHSAGNIIVKGSYTQRSAGTLIVENGGPFLGQFDSLQISGQATLGGKLDVKTINGYKPDPKDVFNPLGYGSVSGSFASVSGNAKVTIKPTGMLTTVDPTKPQPLSGQLVNISTRMQVQTGNEVMIAGFIVTGPAGSTKKVMIRGLGPSLPVGAPLADPLLELHNPDGSTVVNDDWQQGDTSKIPTGFSPSKPKESVIVATLTVGSAGYSNYTAIEKGAQGETGVGLVEVYDLESGTTTQLANISTRGRVETGEDVMIGGFIVAGSEPTKVLVRALGASLGGDGALQDPELQLVDPNGSSISNDDWRNTQEAEITATGVAPSDQRESALIATLVPGAYTAIVRGKDGTTGVGLVEAYNLQ